MNEAEIKRIATILIEHFEGCELHSYVLKGETWATVGRGHAIPLESHPMTITQAEADTLFHTDLDVRWADMQKHISSLEVMTVGQCAATLSFRFNTKPYAFNSSTFVKDLNCKRFTVAGSELTRWVHSEDGEVLAGLVRRRKCELFIFTGGDIAKLQALNFFIGKA